MNNKQYRTINAYINRIRDLNRIQYAKAFALFLGHMGKCPKAATFGLTEHATDDIRMRMLGILKENHDNCLIAQRLPDLSKLYCQECERGAGKHYEHCSPQVQ
jgi:hypothetical protein